MKLTRFLGYVAIVFVYILFVYFFLVTSSIFTLELGNLGIMVESDKYGWPMTFYEVIYSCSPPVCGDKFPQTEFKLGSLIFDIFYILTGVALAIAPLLFLLFLLRSTIARHKLRKNINSEPVIIQEPKTSA